MATHSFPVPTQFISICYRFSARKMLDGHKLELAYLYACGIIHTRRYLQTWKWNAEGGQKCLLFWGGLKPSMLPWWQNFLCSYCGAPLVESYGKESNSSDTNWMRYLCSLYFIKIWLSIRHHLANLHILETWISLERIEIFENSKRQLFSCTYFLFIFKMG